MGSASTKPKVAVIGTGGTICSIGADSLDVLDYQSTQQTIEVDELIGMFPAVDEVAEVVPIPFKVVPSPEIYFPIWRELVLLCDKAVSDHRDLAGIVVLHGTDTLEETAYFLHLTLKVNVPVVLVGSQRPPSAVSSDAGMNLINGIRTAASANARGLGVLVLLNDEIQSAREVTKTSTLRLQTFRSPDFGPLGHVDGDIVSIYRKPVRRHAPDTEFDIRLLATQPRVDVVYAYAGADGAATTAFVYAGAEGIVSAGFGGGGCGAAQERALKAAVDCGIVVVLSTRSNGRTFKSTWAKNNGFLAADNLNPQKARILLALALSMTREAAQLERIFATY